MIKKYIFSFLFSFLLSFPPCLFAISPSEKIPIVAWWLTPSQNYPRIPKIKDIKDCGFNTILYYDEGKPNADSVCKAAAKSGLNVILGATKLKTEKAQSYIRSLADRKNIIGWYLKDEPLYSDLPALKEEYDSLSKYSQNKPIYINLIGCRSDKYTGPCQTIGEYLDPCTMLT